MFVETTSRELSDGALVQVTTLRTDGSETFHLERDPIIESRGVIRSYRISLLARSDMHILPSQPLGSLPEELMSRYQAGSVMVPTPDLWGGLSGCYHLDKGRIITLRGDERAPWGGYLGLTREIGVTMTPLVSNGLAVNLDDIMATPMVLADPRLVFAFNGTKTVPDEFFDLIQPMMPGSLKEFQALIRGESVGVQDVFPMSESDFKRLSDIADIYNLDHLRFHTYGEMMCMLIQGPLPRRRMPMSSIGIDAEGKVMAVAVDGDGIESPGVTLEDLAEIVAEQGAVTASLSGGNVDLFAGIKQADGSIKTSRTRHSEKTKDVRGSGRRIPNALIIVP